MSSAEPFMPAHEPPSPAPPTGLDLDHDADLAFAPGPDPAADAAFAQSGGGTDTPFHAPVPGAHLSKDALEADLGPLDETSADPDARG